MELDESDDSRDESMGVSAEEQDYPSPDEEMGDANDPDPEVESGFEQVPGTGPGPGPQPEVIIQDVDDECAVRNEIQFAVDQASDTEANIEAGNVALESSKHHDRNSEEVRPSGSISAIEGPDPDARDASDKLISDLMEPESEEAPDMAPNEDSSDNSTEEKAGVEEQGEEDQYKRVEEEAEVNAQNEFEGQLREQLEDAVDIGVNTVENEGYGNDETLDGSVGDNDKTGNTGTNGYSDEQSRSTCPYDDVPAIGPDQEPVEVKELEGERKEAGPDRLGEPQGSDRVNGGNGEGEGNGKDGACDTKGDGSETDESGTMPVNESKGDTTSTESNNTPAIDTAIRSLSSFKEAQSTEEDNSTRFTAPKSVINTTEDSAGQNTEHSVSKVVQHALKLEQPESTQEGNQVQTQGRTQENPPLRTEDTIKNNVQESVQESIQEHDQESDRESHPVSAHSDTPNGVQKPQEPHIPSNSSEPNYHHNSSTTTNLLKDITKMPGTVSIEEKAESQADDGGLTVTFSYQGEPFPLAHGKDRLVKEIPECSLEGLFDIVRHGIPNLSIERELVFHIEPLDLTISEDNLYTREATLSDLFLLLPCKSHMWPRKGLLITIDTDDRFISKFNALFAELSELPPAKRQKLA